MKNLNEKKLEELEKLKWHPWIGKNFNKTKLLIVGESHYEDGDEWQLGNKNTTKTIIEKRINGDRGRLHTNIEKTLLNLDKPTIDQGINFWNSIAYWNLVQRLLDSRNQVDRPKDEDFDIGWEIFFKLIDTLKPNYIVIVGKSGVGRLGSFLTLNETGWERNRSDFESKEKVVIRLKKGDKTLKLIFINHASAFYSYKKWSELIHNEHPELSKLLLNQ